MGEMLSSDSLNSLMAELKALDGGQVDVGGKLLKPSQCYYYDISPPYVLFNTNCPDSLRARIVQIMTKYIPEFNS